MAAAAIARTVQSVKPHIPLIKFPLRGSQAPSSGTSLNTESMLLGNRSLQPAASHSKPNESTSKGPAIESSELPPRFRRKLLSQEEIEYIEKGGQV